MCILFCISSYIITDKLLKSIFLYVYNNLEYNFISPSFFDSRLCLIHANVNVM